MNSANQTQLLISFIVPYLPTLIVCLAAVIIAISKWNQAPNAAMWAVFGFGLGLVLCITTPIGQWLIQKWVFEGAGAPSRVWAFTVFGLTNAVLHAGIYVMLLVAVFAGRNPAPSRS